MNTVTQFHVILVGGPSDGMEYHLPPSAGSNKNVPPFIFMTPGEIRGAQMEKHEYKRPIKPINGVWRYTYHRTA